VGEHAQLREALPGRVFSGESGQARQDLPVAAEFDADREVFLLGVEAQLFEFGTQPSAGAGTVAASSMAATPQREGL
jgi:hypothetical protein